MVACRPPSPLSQLQSVEPVGIRPVLYLVSVGIEDYGSTALRQAGAGADAQRITESVASLASPYFELRTHLVAGSSATRERVLAALDSVSRVADDDDLVMLYYRGLGGPRFLVLADTSAMPAPPRTPGELPPASFEARLLRPDVLAQWLLALPTRQILMVLEAPEASSYFHAMRERLAAPPDARRAVKDLVAFATPGTPGALTFASGASGVLTAALLDAIDEERAAGGVALFSTLLPRVTYRLDAPIVVHEAGADLVLGADAATAATADALRDPATWPACSSSCPTFLLERIEGGTTLVGRATGLEPEAKLFVNGRRARRDATRFEVELPPAALRAELSLRVLRQDLTRFEVNARLP